VRIAVTGASGFLGRHVLDELTRHDVDVVAMVHAPRGAVVASAARHGRRVTVLCRDLRETGNDLYAAMGRPDALIHLAWGGLANYRSCAHLDEELPAQTRALTELVDDGLGCLVVAGTCFEYGIRTGRLRETLSARPVHPYGIAKDLLRRHLELLRCTVPFALTWGRLFYLYGDGQASTSLYPQLRAAALAGRAALDMSGGEQVRDYLPASEAARLLVRFALARADAGVVNVCSGQPVTVREIAEQWIRANGWHLGLRLGRLPYSDLEPFAFWGDTAKLEAVLSSIGDAGSGPRGVAGAMLPASA
jgi:dTDP-6-deoxy-L-talose 4-dehydrogenase (NAD+)